MYLPACLLSNQNVHQLLKTVHLTTTALPKSISLIFLWERFSQRDTIPIVNPLQYTVCIFWRAMGCTLLFGFVAVLHYWFQNLPYLFVLYCWERDVKLELIWEHKWWVKLHEKLFWKNIWWVYITLKLSIYIKMCCILPNDQQIENQGWFFASRS